jgi:hypothetical protein
MVAIVTLAKDCIIPLGRKVGYKSHFSNMHITMNISTNIRADYIYAHVFMCKKKSLTDDLYRWSIEECTILCPFSAALLPSDLLHTH